MFKDQLVDITVYLPVNTVVYLDNNTRTFLDDVENVQDIYDRDMPKNHFQMTEEGLTCLDCDPNSFGDDYKEKNGYFNLNIDKDGLEMSVKDGDDKADVKIDETGIEIN